LDQNLSIAADYLTRMNAKSADQLLDSDAMTLAQDGNLRVCYAPFDHVARNARIVIVGITPGRVQALNAMVAAQASLRQAASIAEVLTHAKLTGSFSGPLRNNLVAMLDAIGVAKYLQLNSTSELFLDGSKDVHFTSALRYPVFINGANYSGVPNMLRTPVLRNMIETYLVEEVRLLPDALWLPLGPGPEAALKHLSDKGLLDHNKILGGLPHPSGANAERIAVFLGRKAPAKASVKTNPAKLLAAFQSLSAQISNMKQGMLS
jgi:hypothetical protein